jgi:hypothetical protein
MNSKFWRGKMLFCLRKKIKAPQQCYGIDHYG